MDTRTQGLIQTVNPPLVPDLALYENFMQFVGAEDDRIQTQIDGEAARVDCRTNYGESIGINKEEEDVVLSILLDAYHRREDLLKKRNDAMREDNAAGANDRQRAAMAQAREAELIWAQGRISVNMWAELKEQLPDASLRKLDAYVNREFTDDLYSAKSLMFPRSQATR